MPSRSAKASFSSFWAGVPVSEPTGDIRSRALAVDDRPPSELDMAGQYGVSRDVIRRAKE